MTAIVENFINGKLVSSEDAQRYPIYNPALGEVIAHAVFATPTEINQAIESAQAAFLSWSQVPPLRRARIIFKFKELLEKNIDKLAAIVTREHGKVLADAKGSVMRGIELVEFACGIPNLLKGSFSENVATDVDCYTVRQPLGVCVGVTPFNFPVMVPIWMFVPAIACGNTFILKPSEKDPSAPLFLAQLMQQAGLPDGVLNVIQGDKRAVDNLITHPQVCAVSCVGSTPVAESIYQTAIAHHKRAHTFGGAKNHCIVMPDADIAEAAKAISSAAYGSAGERCMALSVVIAVGDEAAEQLIAEIKNAVKDLRIDRGDQDNVDMGPLVTKEHWKRVSDYIALGEKEGADLVIDGRNIKVKDAPNGFFMGACLFDHVKSDMRIYREEIFGPVLSVVRVNDFDAALNLINRHEYGNGTAVFTRDGDVARTFAKQVQVGMVGINVPIPVPVAYHSFGGWKRSIFGDIHMHGDQSVQFYTKVKTITSRWPKGVRASDFHMPSH